MSQSYIFKTSKGLNQSIVKEISAQKKEPDWMLNFRLKALEYFEQASLPKWGPDLNTLDFNDLFFYLKSIDQVKSSWDDLPLNIKKDLDVHGLREAEESCLAGMGAQYESEVVYHQMQEVWEKQGVIFTDTDTALKKYPDIFKEYFASVVPADDNKFASLNSAVWSGGSFIYIPKGVHVTMPLQTFFQIQEERMGQFERTLIIAEENSFVHYIEGCTAPSYRTASLHSAVVEIVAKKGARVRYSTIQNWSDNIFNLVTKRAVAYENATVEWIDGNIGSGVTMKYPTVILKGDGARVDVLSIAVASSKYQNQDTGAKAIHLASNTSSKIISKSISKDGGVCSYRGLVKVAKTAQNCKSYTQCDSLILDKQSKANAYPDIDVLNSMTNIGHEAKISRIEDEQMFYLMSRGISKQDALSLVINGFIEPFVKELPMEYAIEINRLIELEIEKSIK